MKLGIVFEGGASRSLFSCGVMDALLEENIKADYVIGVSAGIAYGTSYVSGQKGRNLELSVKYMHDPRYMGCRHLLNPKKRSYYNMEFAFRQIPDTLVPYDFDAFCNSPVTTIATLTDMSTGMSRYMELPKDDREKHLQILWGSCALPFLFQPVHIDDGVYMDGGISDPIPFRKALEDGCDKVIVVLTREHSYSKSGDSATKLAKAAYRKFPQFADALQNRSQLYNSQRQEIFRMADNGQLFVIAPENTVGFKRTERNPQKLTAIYNDGYNITLNMIDKIKNYINE